MVNGQKKKNQKKKKGALSEGNINELVALECREE